MTYTRSFSRPFCSVVIVLFLVACATAQPSPTPIPPTPIPPTPLPVPAAETIPSLSKATRHALFQQAWALIRDRYVDPDFGGLDWESVQEDYAARVASAASDEEFYALMREMVTELDDKASAFDSAEEIARQDAVFEGMQVRGGIGVQYRDMGDELVLVEVWAGGPADEAGLRPGERILAVDGVPWGQFSSPDAGILAIVGEAGTDVVLSVRSLEGREREVAVTRAVVDLQDVTVRGTMIEGTPIGLLEIGGLEAPDLVQETVGELASSGTLEGLIVDLRASGGGDDKSLLDTLALFVDGGAIGSEMGREMVSGLLIPEGDKMPELEAQPVVVLIGPYTIGTAELFASGMQLHERATIVGLPSAGSTAYVLGHSLSDGSLLYIAEGVYQRPDGTAIEGRGVQPDVIVEGDYWLYEDIVDDPQIQAALEVLDTQ